jgi:16S rRNA (uracil1498-N3)-methyltransferase
MTIHRAYVPPKWLSEATPNSLINLPDDVVHRLCKVVRVTKDEVVELFDGEGLCVQGHVMGTQFQIAKLERRSKSGARITLAQALVATNKLELIVQHATELGVDGMVLFVAQNSVTKITKRTHDQVSRLQRIATDAARQCERADIPEIDGPLDFNDLIGVLTGKTILVGDPREQIRLVDVIDKGAQEIVLVVGPEGGLSPAEINALTRIGGKTVRYGPYVLRTETAGLVGLSIIQSQIS